MTCPKCGHAKSKVVGTAPSTHAVWRNRRCLRCGHRWITAELEDALPECLDSRTRMRVSRV